jgi:hypothetical protein
MDYSTTDIEVLVKQANILGRIGRGLVGAGKGTAKGMLIGGGLGLAAAPLAGAGLATALGVGGAGLYSGAMLGGALRGTVGGLRGLFRNPGAAKAVPQHIAARGATASNLYRAGSAVPALAIGGGAGYLLSDEDSKFMGSAIGATAGLLARPALVKALAKRAGRSA